MLRYSLRSLLFACGVCCILAAVYAYYVSPPSEAVEVYDLMRSLPAGTHRDEVRHLMVNRFSVRQVVLAHAFDHHHGESSIISDSWSLPCGYSAIVLYSWEDGEINALTCHIYDGRRRLWRGVAIDVQ